MMIVIDEDFDRLSEYLTRKSGVLKFFHLHIFAL